MQRVFRYLVMGAFIAFLMPSVYAATTPTPIPTNVPEATVRYMTCDACGLCPVIVNGDSPSCEVDSVPGDWARCVKCLYPDQFPAGSTPDASACDTLRIDPNTNMAEHPVQKGRQYTMLGCISAGTNVGFTSQTGAPSFVQALLNVVFSLTGGIAFLYLMYGGFIFVTSQADPERLNYGRRLVYAAITGLLLTLGSVFLVNLIGAGILKIPGFSTTP